MMMTMRMMIIMEGMRRGEEREGRQESQKKDIYSV